VARRLAARRGEVTPESSTRSNADA
jgi:hypothetical protein